MLTPAIFGRGLSLLIVVFFVIACGPAGPGAGAPISGQPAVQEAWPTRAITIVVPHDVGGSADRLARGLATFLEKSLGVAVKVEDRPGAGGKSGIAHVLGNEDAKAGYLFFETSLDVAAEALDGLGARAQADGLAVLNIAPSMIVVSASSPIKTFDDLIAQVKASGDTFRMGVHPGTLGSAEDLRAAAGVNYRVVTYDGGGTLLAAALGNADHAYFGGIASFWPNVQSGKLRAIMVTNDTKLKATGDTPSWTETAGKMGLTLPETMRSSKAIFAHTDFLKNHPDRADKLAAAIKATFDDPAGYKVFMEATSADGPFMEFRGRVDAAKMFQGTYEAFLKKKK